MISTVRIDKNVNESNNEVSTLKKEEMKQFILILTNNYCFYIL